MDKEKIKWVKTVVLPNLGAAVFWGFATFFWVGVLGILNDWDPLSTNYNRAIVSSIGMVIGLLPIVLQKGGRRMISDLFKSDNFIRFFLWFAVIWGCALFAKFGEEPEGCSLLFFVLMAFISLCAIISAVICVAGIILCPIAAIISFFSMDEPMWGDMEKRKRALGKRSRY